MNDIKPLKDVDWADFFGIKRGGGGSNPPPVDRSGQPQFNGLVDVVSVPMEKGVENNPPHPPPGTCTARVQAAMKAGCRKEEEILQWCAARNLNLSRTECRRVLKHLEQEGGVSELVC